MVNVTVVSEGKKDIRAANALRDAMLQAMQSLEFSQVIVIGLRNGNVSPSDKAVIGVAGGSGQLHADHARQEMEAFVASMRSKRAYLNVVP